MQSIEWIDRAKKASGIDSDRQMAIRLGITPGALSHHRNGRRHTLEEDQCLAIAEMCGIDPAIVMADQLAERTPSPIAKRVYERMGKLAMQAGAAALAIGTILPVAVTNSTAGSTAYAAARAINSILC